MTVPTLIVLIAAVVAVFALPRRWVPVPFLVLACFIPRTQLLDLGLASLTVLRTLTVAALVRVLVRREWKGVTQRAPDFLMYAWAILMVSTVLLHRDPSVQVISRLGLALDGLGLFLVFRFFCRSLRDVTGLCVVLAVLLVPLAVLMLYEKISTHNLLSFFGSVETPALRDGRVRAQGPFRHPILAGTIGALSVPLVVVVWPSRRVIAVIGLAACLCIVATSTSTGPILSLVAAAFALSLWPVRENLRVVRWAVVGLYCVLAAVMSRPAYYVIAQLDLTGSSTAWHRARLIESAGRHFDEWWLAGTDYTRHWMSTGVPFSEDHVDITNHYIALGVYGGLPLLVAFVAVLVVAFRFVGKQLDISRVQGRSALVPWALGCVLFTIAVTCLSISFFDQSLLWMYMTIAFCTMLANQPVAASQPATEPTHLLAVRHRARRRLRARASAGSAAVCRPEEAS